MVNYTILFHRPLSPVDALSQKEALIMYQTVASLFKTAVYCAYTLNGGALTLFAMKDLVIYKYPLICFVIGILCALFTNITAFQVALTGGHFLNPFRDECKRYIAERKIPASLFIYVILTYAFCIASIIAFLIGLTIIVITTH